MTEEERLHLEKTEVEIRKLRLEAELLHATNIIEAEKRTAEQMKLSAEHMKLISEERLNQVRADKAIKENMLYIPIIVAATVGAVIVALSKLFEVIF